MLNFKTHNDCNGNQYQLSIDFDTMSFQVGYNIVIDPHAIVLSKKEINKLAIDLIHEGLYKEN